MNLVRLSVRQPVTVAVGVILILLSGLVALRRIPIQLTPNVEDTIIAVTTRWEGASPIEVEQEIVDPQEEKLQGIANLRSITSKSQQSTGSIRLEFEVGTPKEVALREVSDKLREVPSYPLNVDEPVVQASDPENQDYIAWIVLQTPDPDFDVRTLQDFAQDRIEPLLERLPGISQINVLGGREREVQVRFDPVALASKGITPSAFADAIRRENRDVSAGRLEEFKDDVRLRLAGQFTTLAAVESTVIAQRDGNPVFVRDVADVVETYKEPGGFVRSRGKPVIAINAQKEVGANVMAVMAALREAVGRLNAPGGVLETQANKLGLEGGLKLTQVYDQTIYIDDALALVQSNIWIGGALAILVLLLFLRSVRTVGIIALAIPISVVGAIVAMVALGRSINVISLAGMAFAVGMVVDNAIVVLENIFRHLEMGKPPARAALDGGREVFGAVLASTLTTVAVFIPILLIQEEAGQLFRDISLAIVAAVSLSLLVSVTVIPASAAGILRKRAAGAKSTTGFAANAVAGAVHRLNGSVLLRIGLVTLMAAASIFGTAWLMPPTDYLPQGNRNLVFGLLIPPPGYNLDQLSELGERVEETVRPFWEAGQLEAGTPERASAKAALPAVPTFDRAAGRPGPPVVPPVLDNYFLVSFDGIMFHGAISADPDRVVDLLPLFAHATRAEQTPGVLAFAFQVPLFQLGGSTGSAIKINFAGEDLSAVGRSALAVMLELMGRYSPFSVQPDPSNFNVPTPELQLVPDNVRRAEAGLSFDDLAFAVQMLGDGAIIGDYRREGDAIDLKLISSLALQPGALDRVGTTPLATPDGHTVALGSVATLQRVNAVQQINRVGRQRAITLQFTPPAGVPLEQAVADIGATLEGARARGVIPEDIDTSFTGSASKLEAVRAVLLGDGTIAGLLGSSLVLALLVVYLLLCVLFQSFARPLIILFSVPLATLGGFAALRGVHVWSQVDRYMPLQQLDVLTMLGFVILIGVVVNNAILLVHQAENFMRGDEADERAPLAPREAITEAVRSRVRPILMSTLTSVGGMAPLVLMPGSGSELYRGLGSVVVGGLLVSTLFTLFLVPLAFSLLLDFQARIGRGPAALSSGARIAAGGAASALFLLALFSFAGCAGPRDARTGSERAEAARARAMAWAEQAQPGAATTAVATPPLDDVLASRRPELEALGGPETWRAHQPVLGPALAGASDAVRGVDLTEALEAALLHNLGLRVRDLEARAQEQGVVAEESVFDAVYFADLDWESTERPTPVPVLNGFPLGTGLSVSDRARLSAGARALLSSGATLSASAYLERFNNESPGISFQPDPAYRAGVGIEATQPLLAGYGSATTTAALRLAENALERSREDVQTEALLLSALVEQAYWDLREAHERLAILELSLQRGEEVEAVLRERRVFDAQQAQFSDALATVEARRSALVEARAVVRRASDALKALLDAPDTPLADETLLRPTREFTETSALDDALDLRGAIETALARRPELRAALHDIEDAEIRERLAADLEQPRLDLLGRFDVIGEDGSFGSAGGDLLQDDYYSFLLGLSFELPAGNRAAEAESRRARLAARASLARYEERVREVVLEVKASLRDVQTNRRLLAAARTARLAESENLRTLLLERERRNSLTPEFLSLQFNRQARLAQAQLDELHALANLNRARAALQRALGTGAPLRE